MGLGAGSISNEIRPNQRSNARKQLSRSGQVFGDREFDLPDNLRVDRESIVRID